MEQNVLINIGIQLVKLKCFFGIGIMWTYNGLL